MKMEKVTITERINGIAYDTLTEDDFNFLVERALKSVRKSSGTRKPTARQVENEALVPKILDFLGTAETPLTATAIGDNFGLTSQRVTPILTKMVDTGSIVKAKDKKSTVYSVA